MRPYIKKKNSMEKPRESQETTNPAIDQQEQQTLDTNPADTSSNSEEQFKLPAPQPERPIFFRAFEESYVPSNRRRSVSSTITSGEYEKQQQEELAQQLTQQQLAQQQLAQQGLAQQQLAQQELAQQQLAQQQLAQQGLAQQQLAQQELAQQELAQQQLAQQQLAQQQLAQQQLTQQQLAQQQLAHQQLVQQLTQQQYGQQQMTQQQLNYQQELAYQQFLLHQQLIYNSLGLNLDQPQASSTINSSELARQYYEGLVQPSPQKSPQPSTQKSPQQSTQKSPQQSTQKSPQQSTQKSPQLSTLKSPQLSTLKSPQLSTRKSPQQDEHKTSKSEASRKISTTIKPATFSLTHSSESPPLDHPSTSTTWGTSLSDCITRQILKSNKFSETKRDYKKLIDPLAMHKIKTPCVDSAVKVGIIGGTGLDRNPDIFKDSEVIEVPETPYGETSDTHVLKGKISKTEVILMARHGKDHTINPSDVNYRANIWALKKLGCHIILATSACGSLKLNIKPGHLIVLDSYIDRTKGNRASTFYKVCHVQQADPFDEHLRHCLIKALVDLRYDFVEKGTTVTIEGPRFSTRAESNLYKNWDASVVNMTTVPEAPLAAELGLHYAVLGLVTDRDCQVDNKDDEVSCEKVNLRVEQMREKVHMVLINTIKEIETLDWQTIHTRTLRISLEAIMHR